METQARPIKNPQPKMLQCYGYWAQLLKMIKKTAGAQTIKKPGTQRAVDSLSVGPTRSESQLSMSGLNAC